MELLNRDFWNRTRPDEPLREYPVKAMQFGEGNFLRAFIDWMIECSNRAGKFNGMVQIVQPLPQGTAALIEAQQGLYTLVLRGMENGAPAETSQVISCVKGCLVCDTQWDKVVETALLPTLEVIFSNTTEAGIEYKAEPFTPGKAQITYPAKLAALLYARYQAKLPGVVVMPCELIDRNGATLRECILHYAADWKLEAGFAAWINDSCGFLNTLVDRIVAGYPRTEAEAWCEKFGYKDNLLDIFKIWEGGIAMYGGTIAGVLTIIVWSRAKKIPFAATLDAASSGLILGQVIGRWANFVNREAFGGETDIFCRMGLTTPDGTTYYVHPTFLYESLWNLVGFIIIDRYWLRKGHRKYDGQVFLFYVFWYGAGRSWIEGLRTDNDSVCSSKALII